MKSLQGGGADSGGKDIALGGEINRFWDNLDLMSNLAFQAGIDRVVKVIDGITGYRVETNSTDTTAVLPRLTSLLDRGIDPVIFNRVARQWQSALRNRLLTMSNPEPVTLEMVPESIRRTFTPIEGSGEFLLTISPRKYLFNEESYRRFTRQVEAVDPAISGTPQMSVELMIGTLMDGRDSVLVAIVAIALLLLLHFRGMQGLLAIIPLIAGSVLMLGVMYLIGMKYNYMNFIAMPVILGIGIDNGVHALHRWREEQTQGADRVYESFRFVGRAILMTTLTTMIGFGSLAFYAMRGIASFGLLLMVGVGLCFLATVTVLPAVMRLASNSRDS
jgi:hypothetical protein